MYDFNEMKSKQGWMRGRAKVSLANLVFKPKDSELLFQPRPRGGLCTINVTMS